MNNNNNMDNFQYSTFNISVISNIIFDPYFTPTIKSHFGKNIKIFPIQYGEHNEMQERKQLEHSDIIVVWLDLETAYSNIWNALYSQITTEQKMIKKIISICNRLNADLSIYKNAHIFWFSFEDYLNKLPIVIGYQYKVFIDKLNTELSDTVENNVSIIDLKRLVAVIGITNAYDPKGKYRWNAPYSKVLVEAAVKEMHKQYLIEKGITKKCLVLDCDNVLWGGILSEDGIENIKLGKTGLGRAYQDFQRFILSLYYHGVILSVCSKNDYSDVITMFREHSEMVLREEHIACFQVNWGNKPDNIKRISEKLNIGLDSIVFIDDSPIEIATVKAILPMVVAILYDRDSIYDGLSCFNLRNNVNIKDIEKRNNTYRTNQAREVLKSQYGNYDDYVNALDIKADIHEALPIEYNRIAELTQRTNKCTNGKRYTVAKIKERMAHENVKLYSISVVDQFSDLGIVGVLEIEENTLTMFSISCRALGQRIENKLLEYIANEYKINSIEFKPTGKNDSVKTIFSKYFPSATLLN
jgi:FkbH-like protein